MRIKSKIWLDEGGEQVMGGGKASILRAIERTGSINKAAAELKMSYRHAWSYIKSAEERLGKPLIEKVRGGKNGGGAYLTDFAKELIKKYDLLNNEIQKFADKKYMEIF